MAGKRVRQTRKKRLGLLVLAAAGALLFLGGPRGAAANSPLEQEAPPGLEETARITPEKPEPSDRGDLSSSDVTKALLEKPKAVMPEEDVPESSTEEMSAPAAKDILAEDPSPVVEESEPVEDTYFDDVLFLGDSRTEGFHLYSGLKTGSYLYATGATVESVFTKSVNTPKGKMPMLDALAQMDCGKIYVMLGVNELGWNGTDIFRNQTAKMIERIRTDHPDAALVIQSILPVSAKQDAKHSYVNNQRISAYNQVLQELAEQYELPYLNVAEAVSDENGYLRADWNFDGVHLNKAGCQAWLNYLRTHPVT